MTGQLFPADADFEFDIDSQRTEWATPAEFFDPLDAEFGFTVDVCALAWSAKCDRYWTPFDDALAQDWCGETFWMNPPYGRGQDVYTWVEKAFRSAQQGGLGVCLLPASTDTRWYHDFALRADEIRFVRDRIWFELGGKAARANHASIVLVFRPGCRWSVPRISTISNGRGNPHGR